MELNGLPIDIGPKPKKSTTLGAMMDVIGLADVWRSHHPREREFTFMSHVHGS